MADLLRVEHLVVEGGRGERRHPIVDDIGFTLHGTPGGQATVSIDGARGKFFLPETRPGEYSGNYTIRNSDQIMANSPVVATLRVGDRSTSVPPGPGLAGQPYHPFGSSSWTRKPIAGRRPPSPSSQAGSRRSSTVHPHRSSVPLTSHPPPLCSAPMRQSGSSCGGSHRPARPR